MEEYPELFTGPPRRNMTGFAVGSCFCSETSNAARKLGGSSRLNVGRMQREGTEMLLRGIISSSSLSLSLLLSSFDVCFAVTAEGFGPGFAFVAVAVFETVNLFDEILVVDLIVAGFDVDVVVVVVTVVEIRFAAADEATTFVGGFLAGTVADDDDAGGTEVDFLPSGAVSRFQVVEVTPIFA